MKYMKNCKWLFASYLLLVPVSTVTSVLFSLGLEPLINVASVNDWKHFAGYLLLELVFALADVGANYLHRISRERMRFYYVTGLRRDCFEAVMDKNIADFYRHADSEYLSALNRDVDKLNLNVFDSACGFYRVAVGFLIHLYVILRVNVWIVLVNIVLSFVSVTIPRFFEKKLIEAQNMSSRASENYYGNLNDALRGFTTIKIFRISDVIRKRLEAANRHLEETNYRSFRKNYSVSCISMLCTNISYVLTIGAGVYFTLTGRMSVGQIIAVSQLMGGIAVPFEELPVLLSNYRSVTDVRQKLLDLIWMRRQNASARSGVLDKTPKTIELKDVSFRFEKQEKGFEHLSYVFEADQKYIVLGESGSGKSTLAKLLSGFYRCDAGEICIDHDNIDQMSEESLYRRVNYIEQRVFLFNDTLRSNITMYKDYGPDEIENAVRLAGLKELVDRLPQHLETLVEGNGVNFSGGEMQRIAIARAILAKSRFMIFDEATANMDTALAREIEGIIMNLEHTGIIYITHHQSKELLRAADHVLTMKDWRIL